jgi:hypothetical protein
VFMISTRVDFHAGSQVRIGHDSTNWTVERTSQKRREGLDASLAFASIHRVASLQPSTATMAHPVVRSGALTLAA